MVDFGLLARLVSGREIAFHVTVTNWFSATTWAVRDDKKLDGIVALQLHAGKSMGVEFLDIKIKELP